MNEILINTVENSINHIDKYDRSFEIKSKLNELKSLTYEDDDQGKVN